MTTAAASWSGWYTGRAVRMSPAELLWRLRDRMVRAAWSRRQVTRHQLARTAAGAPARELAFTVEEASRLLASEGIGLSRERGVAR